MDNKQIEEAAAYFRYEHLPQEVLLKAKPLIELAQLFLSVRGVPKKKVDFGKDCFGCLNGNKCEVCALQKYNLCHDEFTAWLAGKINVERIALCIAQHTHDGSSPLSIATAIKTMILGGENEKTNYLECP